MDQTKVITVAIVEDDDEIRGLLETLIDRSPGFTCKQVFSDCESAIQPICENCPDVVLMDIELPGMNGIEGIRKLKEKTPETDFIMLTIRNDDESVFQSLCAGASGYLLKDTPPVELLASIREVHDGGSPMTPSIARKITSSFHLRTSPLSERETEVLGKLCEGQNYNDIASSLFVSGHTVRAHIKNIYRKLHVGNRAEMVKKALKDKLV